MARERTLRYALACCVLVGSALAVSSGMTARAADSNRPRSDATRPACPDSEAVWSTVTGLVPSATARLLAARPRVEIVDLGERYRVRVTTEGGVLERTYLDPDRDCEKRRRFVAEFIVLSLLPPELAMEPSAPPVPSSTPAPSAVPPPGTTSPPSTSPASSATPSAQAASPSLPGAASTGIPPTEPALSAPPPAASSAPKAVRATSVRRMGPAFARVEVSALGEASLPVAGAPGFLAWGADLRARLGAGRWAATAGVGYWPKAEFVASGVRGSVTRVPVVVGARARAIGRPLELSGDFGFAVAFERYDGLSLHDPAGAARLAPGLEAGLAAATHGLVGFAPFLALRIDWFPVTKELAAAPQGRLGNTPSLWIGLALGMSWEP